jgi:hypothetical protein
MGQSWESPASNRIALFLTLLTLCASTVLGSLAYGNDRRAKPTDFPAEVIGHLPLPAGPGNEMVLQKIGDKHYLYIQEAGKQDYMIANVTHPDQPYLVNRPAKGSSAPGKLEVVGPDLGISEVPDKSSPTARRSVPSAATETVRLMDLRDPTNPRTIQTFEGVTSIVGDAPRGLFFIVNNDGLWVLKHHREFMVPAREKKPCDSESAIQAMPPDCQ